MNKIFFLIFAICFAILPLNLASAQEQALPEGFEDKVFKAKVIKILKEETINDPYSGSFTQQNILIKGLEGEWLDKEIEVLGIADYIVAESKTYEAGDKILVNQSIRPNQKDAYYILDHIRTTPLVWLTIIFIAAVLLVARFKGLKALIVLGASAAIILKFVIPEIIKGTNPILVSLIASVIILFLAIFVTEGYNKKSRISFISLLGSLGLIVFLSWLFVGIANLSGLATEEAAYLLSLGEYSFNLKGLLLAGIIIGSLGVLDDTVVSQVSLVKELKETNNSLDSKELFLKAMRVGTDHINAIINTLFLAYAGVALPLLVLFSIYDSQTLSLSYVLNGELIATEIIRTLSGSIALVLSVPMATALAVWRYSKK